MNRPSKLWNGLQLADDPAVGTGSHQHNIAHHDMLVVDSLSAIENLESVVRGIVEFDHVALWGIKDGVYLVTLIEVARRKSAA